MAQVALAWLADRPAVTSVILGARTIEQLDDNLGAADLHLDDDETAAARRGQRPRRRRLPLRRTRASTSAAAPSTPRDWLADAP